MILGIVGDFDRAKIKALIDEKLGTWKPSQKAVIPPFLRFLKLIWAVFSLLISHN